jgi:hypothetical protein
VRVVSPATSLACIPDEQRRIAEERLAGLGLEVTYSKNAEILDEFDSAPVGARVADLHEAFSDPNVEGMLTTLGGYNSNQLLRSLDYGLIRDNPRILCAFSDITALATAIHTRTGLVTYSGPHYSTFAMKRGIEYTLAHFERCLMQEGPYEVVPADHWSDDPWYADQENREGRRVREVPEGFGGGHEDARGHPREQTRVRRDTRSRRCQRRVHYAPVHLPHRRPGQGERRGRDGPAHDRRALKRPRRPDRSLLRRGPGGPPRPPG